MGEDLTLGGEHAIQCTDDVLQNYTLESCIIINQCNPNKLNKKEKSFKKMLKGLGKEYIIYIYIKRDSQRGKGVGAGGQRGGSIGMKRDFALGDGYTMQYTHDVLLSCTLETYMVL